MITSRYLSSEEYMLHSIFQFLVHLETADSQNQSLRITTQAAFTGSKSTMKTPEQCVKSVKS